MNTKCHLLNKDTLTETDLSKDTFDHIKEYVDESHLFRDLLKCKDCGQLYFFEFYEEVDWVDGQDPQYTTWIPVESEEKSDEMNKLSPLEILQFFPRIQKDFPKEATTPTIKIIGRE